MAHAFAIIRRMDRRDFIRSIGAAGAFAVAPGMSNAAGLIVTKARGLKITGTFLDEISHDIPHQNWGEREWDTDFGHMKAVGIDTVIMIRCGHRKFITYPSEYLMRTRGCYKPSVDLMDLFLRLAEKHGMSFYFGLYDPHADFPTYAEVNMAVVEEVWKAYGRYPAFKGWYVSSELSRKKPGCIESIARMGRQCKEVSGGLTTFISPYIDGTKAVEAFKGILGKKGGVSVDQHEREWSEIMDGIRGTIDVCAFQDGHVDYSELAEFLEVNKKLCARYGMRCWTNVESFDRDMPIKYLPIKFDKLRMKLEAAADAGLEKAITFEFSHFMSPQSCYSAAGKLYDRYREYFGI